MRSAILVLLGFSVCVNAQTRSLTIHPARVQGLESMTRDAMDAELKRLLAPARIDVSLEKAGKPAKLPPIYEHLVTASFAGNCSVDGLSTWSVTPGNVLGEAAMSDGRVLPYFTVDCSRILRILSPVMQPLNRPFRESLLGRALARVIAHELFHILAQTGEHDDKGIAQATLSFQNLLAERFELSSDSLVRIQRAQGTPSAN